MSDDEQHDFATGDAGASTTYPQQAGTIRKGAFICLKQRPCKVVDCSTSKTGKHGHAKVHFVGIDIFTGKKYEDLCPSSHNMDVPNVGRADYNVIDIDGDNFCTLMDSKGETKSDLRVPEGDLGDQLKKQFEEGKELIVTVVSAMNEEMICAIKEAPK